MAHVMDLWVLNGYESTLAILTVLRYPLSWLGNWIVPVLPAMDVSFETFRNLHFGVQKSLAVTQNKESRSKGAILLLFAKLSTDFSLSVLIFKPTSSSTLQFLGPVCTQYSTSTSHPFTSEKKRQNQLLHLKTQNSPRLSVGFFHQEAQSLSLLRLTFLTSDIETWVNKIEFKYIPENYRLDTQNDGALEKVDSFEIWPFFGIYVRFPGCRKFTATCGFASDRICIGSVSPCNSRP